MGAGRGLRRAPTPGFGLVAATLLVAACLRSPLTALSSLLEPMRADLDLSTGATALLTSVPVLLFGLAAPLALVLSRRYGLAGGVRIGIAVLTLGTLVRFAPGAAWLFAGTALIGVGVAIGNVLLPAFIKVRFPHRIASVMAGFTASMNLAAALAAGSAVPVAAALGVGWRGGLVPCAVLAVGTCAVWSAAARTRDRARVAGSLPAPNAVRSMLRSRRAQWVVIFTAAQSVVYYALLAWLPTIFEAHGLSSTTSGLLLSVTTLVSAPSAIAVASIGVRRADQTWLLYGTVATAGTGLLGLALWTSAAPVLWAVLVGLGQGGAFALALTLFVVRTSTGEQTATLSMLAQAIGYAAAASGPLVAGLLHSATGGWSAALWFLVAMAGIQLVSGRAAARPGVVLPIRQPDQTPTHQPPCRPLEAAATP